MLTSVTCNYNSLIVELALTTYRRLHFSALRIGPTENIFPGVQDSSNVVVHTWFEFDYPEINILPNTLWLRNKLNQHARNSHKATTRVYFLTLHIVVWG